VPFWVYILQSRSSGRFYCGHTSDLDVFKGPWEVVWTEEHPDRGMAMKQEKSIKKRGIGRYLKDAQLVESRPALAGD